jgi:hypothetical protein
MEDYGGRNSRHTQQKQDISQWGTLTTPQRTTVKTTVPTVAAITAMTTATPLTTTIRMAAGSD